MWYTLYIINSLLNSILLASNNFASITIDAETFNNLESTICSGHSFETDWLDNIILYNFTWNFRFNLTDVDTVTSTREVKELYQWNFLSFKWLISCAPDLIAFKRH